MFVSFVLTIQAARSTQSINVTCSNEMSHVNQLDFEKTLYRPAMRIFDDFDFLSAKYTLISFLSIGNAYFSFILLF